MKINKQIFLEAAENADLVPRIAYQLHDFFLELTDQNKPNDLRDWLYASTANEDLFELLCEARSEGTLLPYLKMIIRIAKRRVNPFYRYREALKIGIMAIMVILLLNYFIPVHPLSRLVFRTKPAEISATQSSVSTDLESRTIWLADSTKIELGPHSTVSYPNESSWPNRKLQITGVATIAVKGSLDNPLQVEAGTYVVQAYNDAVIRYANDQLTLEEEQ